MRNFQVTQRWGGPLVYWDTASLSSLTPERATGPQVDLPSPVGLAELITWSDTTADVSDTGSTVMGEGESFTRAANRFFRAADITYLLCVLTTEGFCHLWFVFRIIDLYWETHSTTELGMWGKVERSKSTFVNGETSKKLLICTIMCRNSSKTVFAFYGGPLVFVWPRLVCMSCVRTWWFNKFVNDCFMPQYLTASYIFVWWSAVGVFL